MPRIRGSSTIASVVHCGIHPFRLRFRNARNNHAEIQRGSDIPGAAAKQSGPSSSAGAPELRRHAGRHGRVGDQGGARAEHLGIDVSAAGGTVYLRGEARSRDTRQLATEVASDVDGVKQVQNEPARQGRFVSAAD